MRRKLCKILSDLLGRRQSLQHKTATDRRIALDPHAYESGRWLRLDSQQRQVRHTSFDFDKLCDRAMACAPGATGIRECIKMEGGYNRVFLIHLDNDVSLVARVPFTLAGPPCLTTNSEVATIEYLGNHTSIPIPNVIDWSDDPSNSIGTEYIIMEQAPGVSLQQVWPTMMTDQRVRVIRSLAMLIKQAASLKWPAYGSIYFSDGNNHRDYCRGLIDIGISRIPATIPLEELDYRGTVDEILELLDHAELALLSLGNSSALEDISRPMLFHPDLNKRNIFLAADDPTKITGITDWQSSSLEPVHHYSDQDHDFCEFPRGWDEDNVENPPTKEQQRIITDVDLCRKTWNVCVRGYMPELYQARTTNEEYLRLFLSASASWQLGATALREDLIRLSQRWSSELGLEGECPYQPTADEKERHKLLFKELEKAEAIESGICKRLGTGASGWVPIDRWAGVKEMHDLLFSQYLERVVTTGEMTEEKARKMWPFDVDDE